MAWTVVPRRRTLERKFKIPTGPLGEAVLCLGLGGLSPGCNLDIVLQDPSGAELWRVTPREPVARLRTATWRDIAISLARRTSAGLLFEAAARASLHAPLQPLCYEVPIERLSAGNQVTLSLRRLLPPPVLLTHASLATTPNDPAERVVHDHPLEAYAARMGVMTGATVELHVHAPARRFDIAVVRYGATDRIVLTAHGLIGEPQTRPRAAYRLGAGWPVTWRCVTDSSWEPGLYGLRVTDPAGWAMTVPLVVRPTTARARLLVLASTNTWAAYNEWGGASLYKWRKDHALGRDHADRLTRLRPNPAADPERGEGHLAPGLVELVRWLEGAGYEHDLATDEDAHADPRLFERYRCVMTDAHAEYWTVAMRRGLERFLASGGALAYLSGNGMYWKTRATEDGIEVVEPSGVFADGETGGSWADLGAPESELTGVAYTIRGSKTYAPYRVLRPDHWIFEGTGVVAGDTFGKQGAFGAASGHETDKTNRYTPRGAISLARGLNPRRGGADLIYIERANSGPVFSAGSITFVGAIAHDPILDRMMRNVLDRFLVQNEVV
jgi:hypothetical protein